MLPTAKNDIEAIDFILSKIYEDRIAYKIDESVVKDLFTETDYTDAERIYRKLKKLELITQNKISVFYTISDYAIEIINEHKTYSNYISSTLATQRKKDKGVIFDRVIKNGNIIAALLISALSLVLTQCPKDNSKEQQRIEQGLQSIVKELDSLKKVLPQSPQQKAMKPSQDTATNK